MTDIRAGHKVTIIEKGNLHYGRLAVVESIGDGAKFEMENAKRMDLMRGVRMARLQCSWLPEDKWLVLPVAQLARVRNYCKVHNLTGPRRRKNLLPPLKWHDPEV